MMKEVVATGKNVDLAIENGCQSLGVPRDEAQFEIIDLPRKTLFGLKLIPAKVRVYVELPDPKPAPVPQREAPRPAPRPEQKAPPREQKKPEDQAPKAAPAPRTERPAPAPREEENTEPIVPTPELEAKAAAAVAYITDILHEMGNEEVEITPKFTHSGVSLVLTGADLGVVIGRRGETLDAMQYLCGLVANRMEGDYLRVTIDSGNYREKREKTLEELATKLANTAARTGRSYTLEPMNPYERRIIHASVSRVRGVTSASIGEEPNRRVVIKSTAPPPRSGRGGRPGGGRGRPAGSGPIRDGAPSREGAPRDDRGPRPPRDDRGPRPPRDDRGPRGPRPPRDAGPAPDRAPRKLDDFPVPAFGEQTAASTPAPAAEPRPPRSDKSLAESELGGTLYGKIDI